MSTVIVEPVPEAPPEELLGSLTTYSSMHSGGEAGGPAVRTSARVIKKLRLDSSDQRDRKGNPPIHPTHQIPLIHHTFSKMLLIGVHHGSYIGPFLYEKYSI